MIIEAYSIFRSIFPFIKEVFLWRDGATVGKPVTTLNLWRRKLATYVMTISLALNYYAFVKLYKMTEVVIGLKKEVAVLSIPKTPPLSPPVVPVASDSGTPENNMNATKVPHIKHVSH